MCIKRKYTNLIESETIADDAVIANEFQVMHPQGEIVKIDECFMKVHSNYKLWKAQQERINVGVEEAYNIYADQSTVLREKFYWKYNGETKLKH